MKNLDCKIYDNMGGKSSKPQDDAKPKVVYNSQWKEPGELRTKRSGELPSRKQSLDLKNKPNNTSVNKQMTPLLSPLGRGGNVPKPKKTPERVTFRNITRVVYVGDRNVKYVRVRGEWIKLVDARKILA